MWLDWGSSSSAHPFGLVGVTEGFLNSPSPSVFGPEGLDEPSASCPAIRDCLSFVCVLSSPCPVGACITHCSVSPHLLIACHVSRWRLRGSSPVRVLIVVRVCSLGYCFGNRSSGTGRASTPWGSCRAPFDGLRLVVLFVGVYLLARVPEGIAATGR